MALINCVECGMTISDKASNCPHCGCPVEYYLGEDFDKFFIGKSDDTWNQIVKLITVDGDYIAGKRMIHKSAGVSYSAAENIADYIVEHGAAPEAYVPTRPFMQHIESPRDSLIWADVIDQFNANSMMGMINEIKRITRLTDIEARDVYYSIKETGRPPKDIYLSVRKSFHPVWIRIQQMIDFGDTDGAAKAIDRYVCVSTDRYTLDNIIKFMKKYRRPPELCANARNSDHVPFSKKCTFCNAEISESERQCNKCFKKIPSLNCPKCNSERIGMIATLDRNSPYFHYMDPQKLVSIKYQCIYCKHVF